MPTSGLSRSMIVPPEAGFKPLAVRKIELLPAPLAPSSTTSSPSRASRLMPSSARKLP
jgi:hypothetical protein